ncbi:hypothetical protein LL06_19930 [Hoeflea sp. BAL378]|uniref:cellulose biosynthesis protein BcsN n=1 Tax=Hoeflea sp. BAL378 TaxID=1547437 RepID=UPI000513D293|nr:cellulose biosynthesis protein BcsN [Hoeflea sp. BAL378]KGF67846.1 hypothetical protein LL06_19930 [Hoeflea sp. BAL378]
MMPRLMAMMALALALTGCATGNDPALFTGSTPPVAPALIADVAPDYAAAYLPQVAGGVKAVRQSSRPDHIFQTILYPNPGYGDGENELMISIAPPSSGASYFQAPTERQVASEMRAALPGVAMRIASNVGQNPHGPFGYATGAPAGGGACIFAWQTAREIGRADQNGFGKLTRTHYAAKVRLRYCHPSLSEGALVSLMSGLRIREVTAATVEMLRFAEGSGVATQPGYAAQRVQARPVTEPATVKAAAPARPSADETEMPVRSAPRVLKPGELAGYAGAQKAAPVVLAQAAPEDGVAAAAVPLPATLGR